MLNPVFAPDGESIAFFTAAAGRTLRRIPVSGGTASTIATVQVTPFGVSWSAEGILIGQGRGGIVRVSRSGGAPERW